MWKIIKWLCGWKTHKKLSRKDSQILRGHIQKIGDLSPKQQVIEYDKVYHHALKKLGYEGSFGEILRKEPVEIGNLQEVWELHKLRNTLVHDLRDFDERYIMKQAQEYKKILLQCISQCSRS